MLRELRSFKARELRAETTDDGKQYLSGYAATFNVLSEDLCYFRERIMPGAFTRALQEKQDVRHLKNHDPNMVLGRTKSGTLELTEDDKGLAFRTLLPKTSYASDLVESVSRGDIDECSFGFVAVRTAWIEEPDPEDEDEVQYIRELHDVDLFDISTVTYPAYPNTSASMERTLRSLFPDGVPQEVEQHNPEVRSEGKPKTKKVEGEDLAAGCFLIVGNPEDTNSWKLPWNLSTDEKRSTHLKNALARFNQIENVSQELRDAAWSKLVTLCKERDIDASSSEEIRSRLTADQIWDFERGYYAADYIRAIQASL